MKNKKYEQLRKDQKLYHRRKQWRLRFGNYYIPHAYSEHTEDRLTYWDDVGFILNGRRVIVWIQHPRMVMSDEISDRARIAAGPAPDLDLDWLFDKSTANYKKVGASRKKVVTYTMPKFSAESKSHFHAEREIEKAMSEDGIDFEVKTSMKAEWLDWAVGVSLVAPVEIRCEKDAIAVAQQVKRILKGESTLEKEFTPSVYGKEHWLTDYAFQESKSLAHAVNI